ncbi:hypothetical protein LWF01_19155 [Saxibacter everestensis]|uniref:Uncharacterized protein n=1 Tax=Saxibacter everestensis TaxID=2909229 RepID=A0ABY8QVI7_9MICO|nr:hypothetical protein LWF01_19155 [Brevibacteriaceae bacterium ZFBP1038]
MIVPVLEAFRRRHRVDEVLAVAGAGMLSAANLSAVEDAGQRFIVGSCTSSAPYDLADHYERHGNLLEDGQIAQTTRITRGRGELSGGTPSKRE